MIWLRSNVGIGSFAWTKDGTTSIPLVPATITIINNTIRFHSRAGMSCLLRSHDEVVRSSSKTKQLVDVVLTACGRRMSVLRNQKGRRRSFVQRGLGLAQPAIWHTHS